VAALGSDISAMKTSGAQPLCRPASWTLEPTRQSVIAKSPRRDGGTHHGRDEVGDELQMLFPTRLDTRPGQDLAGSPLENTNPLQLVAAARQRVDQRHRHRPHDEAHQVFGPHPARRFVRTDELVAIRLLPRDGIRHRRQQFHMSQATARRQQNARQQTVRRQTTDDKPLEGSSMVSLVPGLMSVV